MSTSLLVATLLSWLTAALIAISGRSVWIARALLAIGGLVLLFLAVTNLPEGIAPLKTVLGLATERARFSLSPDALWLMGFGLPGVILAALVGTPASKQASWLFGGAATLIGTLGVFGLQDAVSFLIAWEVMGLGGALMLLGEDLARDTGRPVLLMLGLLEAGSVALLVAFLILSRHAGSVSFDAFAAAARGMPEHERLIVSLLLLFGFGAKIGLLPFYEWFPGAYGAGSGATGAIFSGIVINAAFFALSRGLIEWMPTSAGATVSFSGIIIVAVGVLSAILTALYAFQQEGWRELLSLSSAENGSIAVCLVGISLMFRQDGLMQLAGLAYIVALLHLAGHALAKGALFLTADGVYRVGNYTVVQRGVLAKSPWIFGLGALFGAMSLAAMPPQAGFVSEWYLFQTFFQGFHLLSLGSRLTAAVAGAGLALTAAVALATFAKVFGIGLLGRAEPETKPVPLSNSLAVGLLGILVLTLAGGMPVWIQVLRNVTPRLFGVDVVSSMRDGWVLVPLTAKFAFIAPGALLIAMSLLALIPLSLVALTVHMPRRTVPVWYGGAEKSPKHVATTALTFSNALRTFYSFIYRPTVSTEHEVSTASNGQPYFIKRLVFTHDVAPIFGPYLFAPLEKLVIWLAAKLRPIQSGHLNFYLALIGALLLIILIVVLV